MPCGLEDSANLTINKLHCHYWFIFLSSQFQRKLLGSWVIHSFMHAFDKCFLASTV